MPDAIPTAIPSALTAGDTWRFRFTFADAPASAGGALEVFFRGAATLNATGVADGDDWLVTVPATGDGSSRIAAGGYAWAIRYTLAGVAETLDTGSVVVRPDPATATAGQLQSHAERALALIEAALEGRIVSDAEAYAIFGRSLTKTPIEQLQKLRDYYLAELARDRNGGQRPPVLVGFGGRW